VKVPSHTACASVISLLLVLGSWWQRRNCCEMTSVRILVWRFHLARKVRSWSIHLSSPLPARHHNSRNFPVTSFTKFTGAGPIASMVCAILLQEFSESRKEQTRPFPKNQTEHKVKVTLHKSNCALSAAIIYCSQVFTLCPPTRMCTIQLRRHPLRSKGENCSLIKKCSYN
jgi:hypothetical protein